MKQDFVRPHTMLITAISLSAAGAVSSGVASELVLTDCSTLGLRHLMFGQIQPRIQYL